MTVEENILKFLVDSKYLSMENADQIRRLFTEKDILEAARSTLETRSQAISSKLSELKEQTTFGGAELRSAFQDLELELPDVEVILDATKSRLMEQYTTMQELYGQVNSLGAKVKEIGIYLGEIDVCVREVRRFARSVRSHIEQYQEVQESAADLPDVDQTVFNTYTHIIQATKSLKDRSDSHLASASRTPSPVELLGLTFGSNPLFTRKRDADHVTLKPLGHVHIVMFRSVITSYASKQAGDPTQLDSGFIPACKFAGLDPTLYGSMSSLTTRFTPLEDPATFEACATCYDARELQEKLFAREGDIRTDCKQICSHLDAFEFRDMTQYTPPE